MNYSGLIIIALSFLSVLICLFTIWFAISFYRLYAEFSLIITEMSKGLEVSTIRLERMPKILYGKEFILSKSNHPQDLIFSEKEKDFNKNQDKSLLDQIPKSNVEI